MIISYGSNKILNFIPPNINSIKDLNIIPDISEEVQRIAISSKSQYIEIVKKSENEWNLIQPRRGVLKGVEVNSFIDKLSSYRFMNFSSEEINKHSVDGENEAIKFHFRNNRRAS